MQLYPIVVQLDSGYQGIVVYEYIRFLTQRQNASNAMCIVYIIVDTN